MNWSFKKTKRLYLYLGLFIGFMFNSFLHMYFEDKLGLINYLEFVNTHWVDRSIFWGFSGMFFVWG